MRAIEWILDKLPVVIFVVIVIGQIIRGLLKARTGHAEPERPADDLEEQRRVREIQEQIRRRIAERRGQPAAEPVPAAPPPLAPVEGRPPPVARPETTQMPDPFGGPLRRMFEEIERRTQQQPPPRPQPPPPRTATPPTLPQLYDRRVAEVERREQAAEQVRDLETTRVQTQRRAANVAAGKAAEAQSEAALTAAARRAVLADLNDPQALRRAFVLREVLGTPVGLK